MISTLRIKDSQSPQLKMHVIVEIKELDVGPTIIRGEA
jgi:hypothetical protein